MQPGAMMLALCAVLLLACDLPQCSARQHSALSAHLARPLLQRLWRSTEQNEQPAERYATRVYRENRDPLSRRHSVCEESDWRKVSLKTIRQIPLAGAFRDLRGQTKFEASGVAVRNNEYYVVFDNIKALGVVDDQFQFRDRGNKLVGPIDGEDSQFEGIAYIPEDDTLLIVREAMEHGDHYHPVAQEVKLSKDGGDYSIQRNCSVDYELSHGNKGFEGVQYHKDADGDRWLLGLCEGNYCEGGKRGRESGNGRIIATKLKEDANDDSCTWETQKTIEIPKTADFQDYSDFSFFGNRVAITSQENSAVWIGDFDFDKLEFASEGRVFHFPRNDHCDLIYCTVEGVEWIDEDRLMLVSDRAKADQPFVCTQRDQSIHIMVLPHGHRKDANSHSEL